MQNAAQVCGKSQIGLTIPKQSATRGAPQKENWKDNWQLKRKMCVISRLLATLALLDTSEAGE